MLTVEERKPVHVAMPKLKGAPAYARPPRSVPDSERPLDPDDFPITAFQTDEERDMVRSLREHRSVRAQGALDAGDAALRPSESGGLRAIASRLLRSRD